MIAFVLALALGAAPAELPERMPEVCLEDLERFPNMECVTANVLFADAHYEAIFQRWEVTRSVESGIWANEADTQRRIWGLLHLAMERRHDSCRCDDGGVLSLLETLRQILGPAAYYRGEMPDAVPVWRFRWF